MRWRGSEINDEARNRKEESMLENLLKQGEGKKLKVWKSYLKKKRHEGKKKKWIIYLMVTKKKQEV